MARPGWRQPSSWAGPAAAWENQKPSSSWAGATLIERALATLRQLTDEILLVGGDGRPFARLGLPHYGDLLPGGALAGIHSAIRHSPRRHTLVVACDMPTLSAPLLRAMADSALRGNFDVVVPTVAGYPQGLHAIYGRACLAPHRRAAAAPGDGR